MLRRQGLVDLFAKTTRARLLGDRHLLLRPDDRAAAEAQLEDVLGEALSKFLEHEDTSTPAIDERWASARIDSAVDEVMEALQSAERVQVVVPEGMVRDTLLDLVTRWSARGPFAPFRDLTAPLAREVVVQLTRWGAIRLTAAEGVALVERLAEGYRLEVSAFLGMRSPDQKALASDGPARTLLIQALRERTAGSLRESPEQVTMLATDAQIQGLLAPAIEIRVAMALNRFRQDPEEMKIPPPFGGGPAGGLPAEVRAWHVAPGPIPAEEDPERRERPDPAKKPGGRRN